MNNKKQVFLLFKNAFKQALRNKIQLIGLIVLVLLSSTIFSIMQTSISRVEKQYDNLVISSNLHDFVIDLSNTNEKKQPSVPGKDPNVSDEQYVIREINNSLGSLPNNLSFKWDRVEARTVQLNNNGNPLTLKLIAAKESAKVDKLVISEGDSIGQNPNYLTPASKQVVINQQFAQKNDLKIGDVIRVQEDNLGSSLKVNYNINDPKYKNYDWLQIVGFGASADFTTPIIDQSTPIPNKAKQGIIYVDPLQFGLSPKDADSNSVLWSYNKSKELITISSQLDQEIYYVGKFNNESNNNQNTINLISQKLRTYYVSSSDANDALVYKLGDAKYKFNSRTATLPKTIRSFTILLILLLTIILFITGITVVLVTYKNIDNAKPSIGILKSLGYSNWKILITSLAYPMIASIIGTILVFLPASGLQIIIVNTFANYFNLNFGKFIFNAFGFLYCLILVFGFSSLIAWLISSLVVIKKPIDLIHNVVKSRDSHLTHWIKRVSKKRKFLTRFRLALFTSSIGKMTAVALTMFLGTTLMSGAVIGPKIMSDNKTVSYSGMNYKNLVKYTSPVYNSPYSFYKTYDPLQKPWGYFTNTSTDTTTGKNYVYQFPNRNDGKSETSSSQVSYNIYDETAYIKNLLSGNINSEAYAPMAPNPVESGAVENLSVGSLSFLYGKMMTKSFLNGLDNSNSSNPLLSLMISMIWPDATDINNIVNTGKDIFTPATYKSLRNFYIKYRSGINMNLNPKFQNSDKTLNYNTLKSSLSTDIGSWTGDNAKENANELESYVNSFNFDTSDSKYPFHIQGENQIINDITPPNNMNQLISNIIIWYYSLFYNRPGQIIEQGAYELSPYFIRENVSKAFEDLNKQFNISFGVVPFNNQTDELGTYFTGTPDNIKFNNSVYPFTVYGIQDSKELNKPSMMQLYNSKGQNLNGLLVQNYNQQRGDKNNPVNIVINQTIAKQLGLKVGQQFTMTANGKVMEENGKPLGGNNLNDINAIDSETGNETPELNNNVTMLLQNLGFNSSTDLNSDAYSGLPQLGVNSPMTAAVTSGSVTLNQINKSSNFKVVGIYNGYGQPAAYISKDNADQILNYNQTKDSFYQFFRKEWENYGQKTKDNFNIDFSQLNHYDSYKDFIKAVKNPETSSRLQKLNVMFNSEYPIFNFKYSNNSEIYDITQAFSVTQSYGDYSQVGLNGGPGGIKPNGVGSASQIMPLSVQKGILNQITDLVDAILTSFVVFALLISFFIILLTSDLIIYENRKVIATMKTLGYSDHKITNIVIGMYLPVVIFMFIIAFPVAWFIVQFVVNYLAMHSSWVLPLFFVWWLPVVVGLIVLAIYVTTFIIEWNSLKKVKILKILNESD